MIATCMDSDEFGPKGDYEKLAEQIHDELNCKYLQEEICYRNGTRLTSGVDVSARNPIRAECSAPSFSSRDVDGVVLITGGLGGIGLLTAEALVEAGARSIVLCSRSGKVARQGQGLEHLLENLHSTGASIVLETCDTGSEAEVEALLDRVRRTCGPLKAVVHAAGHLVDRIMQNQDEDSMQRSFLPKANGAWYLHKHTLGDPLMSFVTFSSTSALFGNRGQFNYAASNTWMDELCRFRVSKGLPGLSIMWPAVAEVGMAAAMEKRHQYADDQCVFPGEVKVVIRQIVCGTASCSPVVAALPLGFLQATNPTASNLLEPIYAHRDRKVLEDLANQQ